MPQSNKLVQIRSLFPHINEGIIYLNHAATGPFSTPVQNAMQGYIIERGSENIENYLGLMDVIQETLHAIGEIINAPVQNIEFAPNTSYGLNVLANGLQWKSGDRIIIPACEFPANVYPFLQLQSQGVHIDFVPHQEGVFKLDDIEQLITDQTRLLTLSWVQFLSGFKSDLQAISELCKKRDILFVIDAIQGLGALTMDVQNLGVDFMATGGHKWLLSPQGIGFIYMSNTLMEHMKPMRGWLNGPLDWENLLEYNMDLHPDARKFRLGTLNGLGITALNASLHVYQNNDPAWCEKNLLSITSYLRNRMEEIGFVLYGSSSTFHHAGISTFIHPRAEALFNDLKRHRIHIALRNNMLRFSPGYYTSNEDIDRVVSVISNSLKG